MSFPADCAAMSVKSGDGGEGSGLLGSIDSLKTDTQVNVSLRSSSDRILLQFKMELLIIGQ